MIGDIVGESGVRYVKNHLNAIRKLNGIDMVIANGENSAKSGKGITKDAASALFLCGVDVITLGNHAFHHNDVLKLLEEHANIIRPANLPPETAGAGWTVADLGFASVGVVNANGRIYMEPAGCPFRAVQSAVEKIRRQTPVIVVDFHAEATSEKLAMGYLLDGTVTAVVGTHTHIQTADERILPKGTAYITDVGMTGCMESILGVKKEIIIKRFLTTMPQRHEIADGPVTLHGVVIDADASTGRAAVIERLQLC